MKIFLTSDIHSEHAESNANPFIDYENLRFNYPDKTDVVVLAGDVGDGSNGLMWARNRFTDNEIIFVPGNHEYYGNDLSIIEEMSETAKQLGIHLLDNDSVILDGVRFLGSTLWTNFDDYSPEAIAFVEQKIVDYKSITCKKWWCNEQNRENALSLMNIDSDAGFNSDCFSPTVAYLLHKEATEWLSQELNKPHQGKTVVVTHHAPSHRPFGEVIQGYASHLDQFIIDRADKIDLWCHGHFHIAYDYEIAGVRIVSNPRGYPCHDIMPTFKPEKLICL